MTLFIRNCCLKNRLAFLQHEKKSLFHRDCKSFKEIEPYEKTTPPDIEIEEKSPKLVTKNKITAPEVTQKTTAYDKWAVSWVMKKEFPTRAHVPDVISAKVYQKARTILRIRINILLMIFLALLLFTAVRKFRYDRDQQIEMNLQELDRKRRINKEKSIELNEVNTEEVVVKSS